MVEIMVRYRNPISKQDFNTIYGIYDKENFDTWLNAQACLN